MRKGLIGALIVVVPFGLAACSADVRSDREPAAASNEPTKQSRRGDAWLGNASSFPYQR